LVKNCRNYWSFYWPLIKFSGMMVFLSSFFNTVLPQGWKLAPWLKLSPEGKVDLKKWSKYSLRD
jgi:hypothetical protein